MGSETAPTPLTAEEMTARRLAVADRWDRKWPHTRFEMGGAVDRDARLDFNAVEPFVCDYDRRVLLNVVAALMDDLDAARREQAELRERVLAVADQMDVADPMHDPGVADYADMARAALDSTPESGT